MTFDETFDVGMDTRTPVDDNDYQVPFRFTGTIDKLTYQVAPRQVAESEYEIMHAHILKARVSRTGGVTSRG